MGSDHATHRPERAFCQVIPLLYFLPELLATFSVVGITGHHRPLFIDLAGLVFPEKVILALTHATGHSQLHQDPVFKLDHRLDLQHIAQHVESRRDPPAFPQIGQCVQDAADHHPVSHVLDLLCDLFRANSLSPLPDRVLHQHLLRDDGLSGIHDEDTVIPAHVFGETGRIDSAA